MAVDVRKWLSDNLNALNLPAEDRAAAERIFSGPVGQTLGSSLYQQQDISALQSALDRQRNQYEAQKSELEQWNLSWQERYEQDLRDVGAVDKLAAAGFDVSDIQATRGGGVQNMSTGQTFTKEEVAAMLQQQAQQLQQSIEPVRAGLADFATFVADFSGEYRETFGKRFPAAEFRKFAYEHRDKYPTLESAADAFTAEDRKAKEEADRKKWEEDKTKEIEANLMARMQIPEAAGNGADGAPFHAVRDQIKPSEDAPSKQQNRQEFAKKFQGQDFNITI